MAVGKQDKHNVEKKSSSLSAMWSKAPASVVNAAAGKYIFKIESCKYEENEKGARIKEILKIVGGNEEFIGEAIPQYDNLATEQNISFFKQKLIKLGIDIPEDFSEIEDGTVCEAMEDIVFEGELKINGAYINVYVTKLADDEEEDGDDDSNDEEAEEDDSEEEEDSSKEDKDSEDETEEEDEEEDEESKEDEEEEDDTEDAEEEGEDNFPTPDEVASMKMKDISSVLSAVGIDSKEVAAPRKIVETMSNYLYTDKYIPEIDGFNALVKVLNIKGLKGLTSKDKNKKVKKAVEALLS